MRIGKQNKQDNYKMKMFSKFKSNLGQLSYLCKKPETF